MAASVSVVVITRDRPDDLRRSLEHLTSLPERPAVLVVDHGSTVRYIPDMRRRYPEVRFLPVPTNRGAAGRTIGARAAATDYVAFADDDSWWAPGALDRAVSYMEGEPRVGLVAGRVVVQPAGVDDPTSVAMAAGPIGPDLAPATAGPRAIVGCMACGSVVRRRAYLSVGGFPLGMGVGGEEQILVWDLWTTGWRAVYLAEVTAYHQPAASRDPAARRATVTRNDLWTCWARLPARSAWARTASVLADGAAEPWATARGLGRATRRADWALARRSRLPAALEQARKLVAS